MDQQVIKYIEESLRIGSTKSEIEEALMKVGGWSAEEVEQGFREVARLNQVKPEIVVPKHEYSSLTEHPAHTAVAAEAPVENPKADSPTPEKENIASVLDSSTRRTGPNITRAFEEEHSMAMQPKTQDTYAYSNMPKSPKPAKGSRSMIPLIVIIFLLFSGASFASYYYLFSKTPDQILWAAVDNFDSAKSFDYNTDIRSEISGLFDQGNINQLQTTGLATIVEENISSSSDQVFATGVFSIKSKGVTDIENSKGQAEISISADGSTAGMRFGVSVDLEFRLVDNNIYAVLKTFPDVGFDLSSIKNVWVQASAEDTVNQALSQVSVEQGQVDQQLTTSKELLKTFREANIISVSEKMADETIRGIDSYHYKLSLNKTNLRKFITDSVQTTDIQTTEESLAELDKFLADLETTGDIWIGKSDYNIYKISLVANVDVEAYQGDGKLTVLGEFFKYNEPKEIIAPAPTRPLEDVIADFFAAMFAPVEEPVVETIAPPVPESTVPFVND